VLGKNPWTSTYKGTTLSLSYCTWNGASSSKPAIPACAIYSTPFLRIAKPLWFHNDVLRHTQLSV
jgi:hypothetical protein